MTSTRSASSDLLAIYPHITGRDRQLLHLLDEHQLLTTDQIQRLFFHATRTCQLRLETLRRLGLVERFRFARPDGGTFPWHWTLGLAGARLQAAASRRPEPTNRAYRQQFDSLSTNPHLRHLRATNELFVRLAHHTRTHPDLRLRRWWSERRSTQLFQSIAADGHGLWSDGQHTVGFFVECDHATEPHHRVLAKLDGYQRLAARGGPRYPVLLWLASPEREQRLHRSLTAHPAMVTVATATHDNDPARDVWLARSSYVRVGLLGLPSSHGHNTAANPNFIDGQLALDNDFLELR